MRMRGSSVKARKTEGGARAADARAMRRHLAPQLTMIAAAQGRWVSSQTPRFRRRRATAYGWEVRSRRTSATGANTNVHVT
ncbi:hypothetical protein DFH09DRAFT_1312595 [Mycena vulgaris]|nr:hypothetical protein DFH09DRAFT_1312595 [Mycena vulgaris]